MNSLDFYSGKRVLVTGHTGFKGGWLTVWLKLLRAEVIGFSLPPATQPNLFTSVRIGEGIVSEFGDVRSFLAVKEVFSKFKPEVVIHNAAQALVRRSYRDPIGTYATNVMGTAHVLEAARHTDSVRSVVVVTSDKCYENHESARAYREEDALGGQDPYSSSKAAAELVTAAYRRSFFGSRNSAAVASVRAGNVIGGGDWSEDRLVPDIVRSISSGRPIIIRSPKSIRPWQHVLEPLGGYLLLGERLYETGSQYAGAWNFGPKRCDSITVEEIAGRVRSIWGKGEVCIEPDPAGPHEAKYLHLDSTKSFEFLGWSSRLSLTQALEWTVEWYRSFYDRGLISLRELTEHQIRTYMRSEPS